MASEQLSAARYSTLHLVVPAKERLMRSLSVKTEDTFAIKRLKESLRRLLDEKFILADEHFMAAALWPPHRHFRGMQTVSQAKVRQVHQSLEEEVRYQPICPPQVQVSQMSQMPPAEPTPGPSSSEVSQLLHAGKIALTVSGLMHIHVCNVLGSVISRECYQVMRRRDSKQYRIPF